MAASFSGSGMAASASASRAMQQAQHDVRGSAEPVAKVKEVPNRLASLSMSVAGLEDLTGHIIGRLAPVSRTQPAEDTGHAAPPCQTHVCAQIAELENRVIALGERLRVALELLELP